MSDSSDIEIQTTLPKKQTKKIPKSPSEEILKRNEEPKKPSTKVMVHQALTELKSRKGTSLYAIKKYIHETFGVDVEKTNYIIKKMIKAEVEAGNIVQTKGIGASGSFKLAVGKEKVEQKKSMVKKITEKKKNTEKSKKAKESEPKAKTVEKKLKKDKKDGGKAKLKAKEKDGVDKKEIVKESKKPKPKGAKPMKTPAKKKAALLKRKSIGSIIKPPKMRPKAKA